MVPDGVSPSASDEVRSMKLIDAARITIIDGISPVGGVLRVPVASSPVFSGGDTLRTISKSTPGTVVPHSPMARLIAQGPFRTLSSP
jgi:hypothetical protein